MAAKAAAAVKKNTWAKTRKPRYSVVFHRPKTLKRTRDPKYTRKRCAQRARRAAGRGRGAGGGRRARVLRTRSLGARRTHWLARAALSCGRGRPLAAQAALRWSRRTMPRASSSGSACGGAADGRRCCHLSVSGLH